MVRIWRQGNNKHNNVAVLASLIGIISLFIGWLTIKPNRISSGNTLYLWDSFGWYNALLIILLWAICLTLSFLPRQKVFTILLGILANLMLIFIFLLAGNTARDIIATSPSLTRVSLSLGILCSAAGALILILAVRKEISQSRIIMSLLSWPWLMVLIILLATGWFNNLSVFQEYFSNSTRFAQELLTHLELFVISISVGMIFGVFLGIWAAGSRKAARPIFFITNITQTIPSLALFGILIVPLSALSNAFPALQDIGIRGIGAAPAIIALIIYSLLPIVQNTYTGLNQINPAILDAGLGMGMNGSQLLLKIKIPLAALLILTGIRTAAVQTVGNIAVAALIGAGGLGIFIFQGLGQAAVDLIILGAVPMILLAVLIDNLMQVIIRLVTPRVSEGPAK